MPSTMPVLRRASRSRVLPGSRDTLRHGGARHAANHNCPADRFHERTWHLGHAIVESDVKTK
jgi:hypothetical protein